MNVNKTFGRYPGGLLNVPCTFNLCPVPREYDTDGKLASKIKRKNKRKIITSKQSNIDVTTAVDDVIFNFVEFFGLRAFLTPDSGRMQRIS